MKALKILFITLALNAGCASYSLTNVLPRSEVIKPAAHSPLAKSVASHTAESGFFPLIDGSSAYDARAALASTAVTSLDIQYYIWHRDRTGMALLAELLDAAERGVRVRLLLDDMNLGDDREFLADLDRHPNLEIRIYNPSSSDGQGLSQVTRGLQLVFDFATMNHRMHNKLFIADSSYAVIGGRNIGDEYFDLKKDRSFRDLDVLTAGPVVRDLGKTFDQYWNSKLVYGLHAEGEPEVQVTGEAWHRLRKDRKIAKGEHPEVLFSDIASQALTLSRIETLSNKLIWAPAQAMADQPVLGDVPGKGLEDQLKKWPRPKREFLVESAYFIPPKELMALFRDLEDKGVEVKILTNSLQSNDVMLAHAGYMSKRQDVLATGAELFEWRMDKVKVNTGKKGGIYASRAGLHSKTFVIDDEYVFIGSMNLDARSIELNTESGMMIQSKELAQIIGRFIKDGMGSESSWKVSLECIDSACQQSRKKVQWVGEKNGRLQTLDHEPESSFWRRSAAKLMSYLPIEDKL